MRETLAKTVTSSAPENSHWQKALDMCKECIVSLFSVMTLTNPWDINCLINPNTKSKEILHNYIKQV